MATKETPTLRSWSTPLVIGAYLVTGISGVMLFFHFGESLVKEAHEWIGMLFVIGAVLHIKSHWTPFKRHFTQSLARAVMVSAVIAGSVFIGFSASEPAGSPVRAVMQSIEKAPLSLVAQLQQRDEAELVKAMESAGLEVTDTAESIQTLAAINKRSSRELIPLLFGRP